MHRLLNRSVRSLSTSFKSQLNFSTQASTLDFVKLQNDVFAATASKNDKIETIDFEALENTLLNKESDKKMTESLTSVMNDTVEEVDFNLLSNDPYVQNVVPLAYRRTHAGNFFPSVFTRNSLVDETEKDIWRQDWFESTFGSDRSQWRYYAQHVLGVRSWNETLGNITATEFESRLQESQLSDRPLPRIPVIKRDGLFEYEKNGTFTQKLLHVHRIISTIAFYKRHLRLKKFEAVRKHRDLNAIQVTIPEGKEYEWIKPLIEDLKETLFMQPNWTPRDKERVIRKTINKCVSLVKTSKKYLDLKKKVQNKRVES